MNYMKKLKVAFIWLRLGDDDDDKAYESMKRRKKVKGVKEKGERRGLVGMIVMRW